MFYNYCSLLLENTVTALPFHPRRAGVRDITITFFSPRRADVRDEEPRREFRLPGGASRVASSGRQPTVDLRDGERFRYWKTHTSGF